jgi:predicted HAD superfamily Cof-like phosphohydrolase
MSNFNKVWHFMHTFGQETPKRPTLPNQKLAQLRVDLIAEELNELVDALADDDMIEIADALTDILYVTYGAGVAFGIELDPCFHEVHRSNMSKLGPDGKPIYREDGKVLKGPDYFEPNLTPYILKGH